MSRAPRPAWRQAAALLFPLLFPSLAEARDLAFVPAQVADRVTVIALDTMQPVADIPVGGKPAGVAVAQQAGRAYVSSPEGRFVTIIDCATATIVGRIDGVGQGPLGIAVHPSGSPLYVADWHQHRIHVVDPLRRELIAAVPVGASPSGLAISTDGRTLLSADRDSHQVSIIDTASRTVRATVAVGTRPFGVTLSADGRRAYTANVGSNDVSVIDVAKATVIGTVPVGERPYAIALTPNGRAFVTDQYAATVTVFDTTTMARLATIPVGEYPEGIATASDGRAVYVVNWDANSVQRLDAERLVVTGSAATADGPRGFGAFVWQEPGTRSERHPAAADAAASTP